MAVPRRRQIELPVHLQVPTVKLRYEWPYFEDSYTENPFSQENIQSDIESLWMFRMLDREDPIDSTDFWGETAEFWLDGADEPIDMYRGQTGHAMLAIANFERIEDRWNELLPKVDCTTYPPTSVLLVMMHEALGPAGTDAWQRVYHQKDSTGAIELIEERLNEASEILKPTMLMFLSSVWSLRGKANKGQSRNDAPDEDEIAMARQIYKANPKLTRDGLAAQMEIGGTKASHLLKILRGVKRRSPKKKD